MVQEAIDLLRGAVTIVYPMGLPPHDVICQEFDNTEDLSGTQSSLEVSMTEKPTTFFLISSYNKFGSHVSDNFA